MTVQGAGDRSIVKVVAPDEQGLLATICRYFQVHDVNIETLQARTRNGVANDTFLVIGNVDAEGLKALLQHPPALAVARDACQSRANVSSARRSVSASGTGVTL